MEQSEYDSKSTKELFMELARIYFIKKYKMSSEQRMYPGQEVLLELVSVEPGLSQKDIAQKLNIQPPTVAVSIKRMEKGGWLKREIDTTDKRVSRVFITANGQKTLDEVKVKTRELDEIVFAGIPEAEKSQVHRILVQIIKNIRSTMDDKEMDEVMEEFKCHHEKQKHSMHQNREDC